MKKSCPPRPAEPSPAPSEPLSTAPPEVAAVTCREQLFRLWTIHQILLEKRSRPPTRRVFAKATHSVLRTVQRDLDTMRFSLLLPIACDGKPWFGYRYTRDDVRFAATAVSPSEFFALAVAAQIVRAYTGIRLEEGLRGALQKLRLELRPELSFDLDTLGEVISFRGTGFDLLEDLSLFQVATTAALEREELCFQYEGMADAASEERTVEPLLVACIENAWYLYARDVGSGRFRTFCLVRMRGVTSTGRRFVRPEDFDPSRVFADAFGAFSGEAPVRVVLRFRGPAARVIRERRWHSSQQVRRQEGGTVEAEFFASDTPDLLQFVLRWGADARVLEPASLREKVLTQARAILDAG